MADEHDFMPIQAIDHVEYYVGNAKQAAYYYCKAMGFHVTAYSGPETGVRGRASRVCEQGEARYVFTGAMSPDSFIAKHAHEHGVGQLVHFRDDQISTEYTALMSKVMWDGVGRVKFPINEPAAGKKKSQIEEYLDYYRSPGVQHIAMATDDIVATVTALRARGM